MTSESQQNSIVLTGRARGAPRAGGAFRLPPTFVVSLTCAVAATIQFALGAQPLVVLLALVGVAAGMGGFVAAGRSNIGAMLALFYVLGNVIVPLYAKTLMGQPLDSHLFAPVDSFLAIAICSSALFAALLIVRRLDLGCPLLTRTSDPRFLAFLSWSCFVLGVGCWILNRWFQDPSGNGFGGISFLRDVLLMSIAARTAMLIEKSQGRRMLDLALLLILATCVFLGFLDDTKTEAALPIATYFATVVLFQQRFPMRTLVTVLVGAGVFVALVAPMIHAFRALGQQQLGLDDRIEFVLSNTTELIDNPEQFSYFEQLAEGEFRDGYYDYFGDNGAEQMLVGRYASVQQIDPVIAEATRMGERGGAAIWPALERLVPAFLDPSKPEYEESYLTLVHYRLIDPQGGKFPTLPLAGQVYAAYGILGLVFLPFLTFLVFLVVVKKLSWDLRGNIYAVFFLCDFVFVYASQGDFGQYTSAALRNFPLMALLFLVLARAYRGWNGATSEGSLPA